MIKQYIHHVPNAPITPETDHIKVKGNTGTWYVIDSLDTHTHGTLYLLEHETYGDEAACIIVDEHCNIVLEDVWNGFDDYFESLD